MLFPEAFAIWAVVAGRAVPGCFRFQGDASETRGIAERRHKLCWRRDRVLLADIMHLACHEAALGNDNNTLT